MLRKCKNMSAGISFSASGRENEEHYEEFCGGICYRNMKQAVNTHYEGDYTNQQRATVHFWLNNLDLLWENKQVTFTLMYLQWKSRGSIGVWKQAIDSSPQKNVLFELHSVYIGCTTFLGGWTSEGFALLTSFLQVFQLNVLLPFLERVDNSDFITLDFNV